MHKNLKVHLNTMITLALTGTMALQFTGCGKEVALSEPEISLVPQTSPQEQYQCKHSFLLYDEQNDRTIKASYSALNSFLKDNIEIVPDYEPYTTELELQFIDEDGVVKKEKVKYEELQDHLDENFKFKGIEHFQSVESQPKSR